MKTMCYHHHPGYHHNGFDNMYQTLTNIKQSKVDSSLHPTSPVQLSTWERSGYIWILHLLKNAQSFSHSLISQISKFTIGLETKV